MKINIQSQTFRDGLNKVLTVIDKKNSRPILTNCLINAYENHIELIATDLEVMAKIKIPANVTEKGNFCINTKNIFEIVRELPDAEMVMDINQESNLLNISCKQINYSLLITNAEDYPQVNFQNSGESFNLKSEDVLKIINKTSHSVSTDETRINLNGIFIQKLDSKLRAVAIDGHRLALLDIHNFDSQNQSLVDGVIIPKKGITELKKIAESDLEANLQISLDDSFMYINSGENYYLSIRLIAREYPKYQTVIPSKTVNSMTIERNALYDAVKRIRILSNEKTNGIKTILTKNQLTISANHPSLGHATEILPVSYEGDDIEIGFNAKYMLDSLHVLDVAEIIYEFNNELSPVIMRSDEEPDFLGIIMPLKL